MLTNTKLNKEKSRTCFPLWSNYGNPKEMKKSATSTKSKWLNTNDINEHLDFVLIKSCSLQTLDWTISLLAVKGHSRRTSLDLMTDSSFRKSLGGGHRKQLEQDPKSGCQTKLKKTI